MAETTYRAEAPGEEAAVAAVVRQAFGAGSGVDDLVRDLGASDAWVGLSFVAVQDDAVVGHVAFTRSRLDAPGALVDVLVLSPLSVAPRWQGRGVGTALTRYALGQLTSRLTARADQAPIAPLVFLEGAPGYYRRFGFVPAGPEGFRRPSLRIPEPAFQVLRLDASAPTLTGTLVYHRAFWDHDAVGLRERSG